MALGDTAALCLTGSQPRARDNPDIMTERMLLARCDFGAASNIASTGTGTGYNEVRAPFIQIGREGGAEREERRHEELALGDGDAWRRR